MTHHIICPLLDIVRSRLHKQFEKIQGSREVPLSFHSQMAAGSVLSVLNNHDLFLFSGGGSGEGGEDSKPQPGYFHVVASFILIIHGFTFLVPPDSEAEDTDMMRTVGKWLGFDWDWMKHFTPYAQVSTRTNQTSLSREGGVSTL